MAQSPDYGEVQPLGFFGRLFGRRAKIVRDADITAALERIPQGATVSSVDPQGNWLVYQKPNCEPTLRFRAWEAWLPNEPTIIGNETRSRIALIDGEGRIVVVEGLHRTRGMARDRTMVDADKGGVPDVPGWLDFVYDPTAVLDTPSARAISIMLGGDPDAPLIRAR